MRIRIITNTKRNRGKGKGDKSATKSIMKLGMEQEGGTIRKYYDWKKGWATSAPFIMRSINRGGQH